MTAFWISIEAAGSHLYVHIALLHDSTGCLTKTYCNSELLTHKHLEMHRCTISTMATDAVVLKHQGFSLHSSKQVSVVLDKLHKNILHLQQTILQTKITFW